MIYIVLAMNVVSAVLHVIRPSAMAPFWLLVHGVLIATLLTMEILA
jgi:hypothetical protein